MPDDITNLTTKELSDKLMASSDKGELDQIISLFNLNLQKKELIRASVLSEIQDNITDQIGKRVEHNSDCFSNKDLIDYMRTVQGILDSQKALDTKQIPTIAIQNNVTITGDQDTLSRDSRDRIADYIKAVLAKKESLPDVIDSVNNEEKDGE